MISPMNLLSQFLHATIALLASLPVTLAAAAIHIAPTGNDANPGSAIAPVATPQAAQTLVKDKDRTVNGTSVSVYRLLSGALAPVRTLLPRNRCPSEAPAPPRESWFFASGSRPALASPAAGVSERVDVDHRKLVELGLHDVTIVMSLNELGPLGGWSPGG